MRALFVSGISTWLLLSAGCATQSHSTITLLPPKTVPCNFHLISATYGSGSAFAEVTSRVDDLLHQPSAEFFARPEWLHADPTVGWNKALVIVYEFEGQRSIFTTGEGGRVSMDELIQASKKKSNA